MSVPRSTATVAAALILLLWPAAAPALAEDAPGERITLDWIFSEQGKTAAAVPERAWLDDGRALLYDKQPPKAERTIEWLDPKTGSRKARVDRHKAMASLDELLKPEEPFEELGWPAGFDPRGRWAVYLKQDDLLLLDLAKSVFVRVTNTAAEEKSPRFSPDGSKLAFVRDNDLYIYEIAAAKERRLTSDGSDTLLNGTVSWVYWEEIFGRNDLGFWWSPDSSSVAYLQTDESPVGLMHFVDYKPNIPRLIRQRYPKTGEANPRVRAGVVDLENRTTTWVDLGRYPYEYLARVQWLPDSRRLCVQTLDRSQTRLDVFLAQAASGEVSHLFRETDEGWVNLHDDLHFFEDGRRFLWVSERDGQAHLYLYGTDGRPIRQVTRGPWSLRSSGGVFWARQSVQHVDEQGGWVYFTALEKSSIERHLYRVRLDGTGLERLTREDGTHRILFSPDGRRYLDAFSAIDTLPSLALHRADGSRVELIQPPRSELVEPFDLQRRELFTIETRDGFAMPAMMLKPRSFQADRRYPVILYVYGGPSAPTVAHAWGRRARDYYEHLLAERGYIVLRVDNRSATAISKKLENLILKQGYGTTELADLLDAVGWLKSRPYVDPERVGIWGWSGGGSFTLLAMTGSNEFRAGVAVAAVTDWSYYDTKWAEAFMKRPQDNPEGYRQTSHAERAGELHGRLLLVHGTYDDNVHPQNAWRFAEELIQAGKIFEMMIYPMRKHGIRDDAAQKHLYATMLEFWERNLN